MTGLVQDLLGQEGTAAYAILAVLVFLETAVLIGVLFPGETAAVVGGVLASQGRISLWLTVAVVVTAAVAGDTAGYGIGRLVGPRVTSMRILRRHRGGIEAATASLRRRGAWAVILGRFVAVVRTVIPTLAGISRMRFPVFLAADTVGGVVWGTAYVLVGRLAGGAWSHAQGVVGRILLVTAAVVVVVGVALLRRRLLR
jgi:membrane-associated protein